MPIKILFYKTVLIAPNVDDVFVCYCMFVKGTRKYSVDGTYYGLIFDLLLSGI